jgi:hypothetical protein
MDLGAAAAISGMATLMSLLDPHLPPDLFEHPDSGALMPFPTEALAVSYCVSRLIPFCTELLQEEPIGNGLRPDLLVRFKGLEDLQLPVEIKAFTVGQIAPFPQAIRQAASYAKQLRISAFVAPLAGRGKLKFEWNVSRIGSGLLIAGHFCVGGLYFSHQRYRNAPVGGLLLAGDTIATFEQREQIGQVRWHSNARHLLAFKFSRGSQSWRI